MQHGGLKCSLKSLKHFNSLASLPALSKTVANVFGCDSYLGVSISPVQVKPGFLKVLSIPCWKSDPFQKPRILKIKVTLTRLLGCVRQARCSVCCTSTWLPAATEASGVLKGVSFNKACVGFPGDVWGLRHGQANGPCERKRMLNGH